MSELVVVGFKNDKNRASEVLGQLEQLQAPATFELDDALAVHRTHSGHLRIDRSLNPTKVQEGVFGGVIATMPGFATCATPSMVTSSSPSITFHTSSCS